MTDFLNSLSGLEKFYVVCAVLGGLVFIIRLVLALIGMDHDADVSVDHDFDVDHEIADHPDSDTAFRFLSIQSISAFILMFGMVGLTASRAVPSVFKFVSLVPAGLAGLGMVWVIGKLMAVLSRMQSSGNIDVKNAVGQEGTVYLTIPAGGSGKVQVDVQNRLMEFDAVSQDNVEIKTGDQIRVVFIKGETLVVEKI